jgi:dienelactone hydrolase
MQSLALACLLFVTSQAVQPDVAARAREVLASLSSQNFAPIEAQFTEQMTAALPAGRLATTWTSLVGQVGSFKSCGSDPRIRTIADKQMVITLCEFERAKIDVQIAFDRDGKISGLAFRPAAAPPAPYALPPYANPSAYAEEEVTIGGTDWPLPATLAMPVGPGPFPAVVLVHGSGPNDRDETLGPNKPFKDLASGLASRGVVVLRYDKRTKVHAAKSAAAADFTVKQEVLDDVVEAVRALRANPKVDRARVFVLGHSLGGMLIPRIGAADGSLAGLIVLAGAARSLEDAILEQTRYIAMGDGAITAEEQSGIDNAAKLGVRVRALTVADAKSAEPIFGAPASYWLDLRGYDPPSAAKALKQPMLVLQGERDYQVTMAEFEKWKTALAGRTNVTFRSYPALNHLFIAGTGKSLPAEYTTPGHVADDVVRDIAAWILKPAG